MRFLVCFVVIALLNISCVTNGQKEVRYQCNSIPNRTALGQCADGANYPWERYVPSSNPELRNICNIPSSAIPGGSANLLAQTRALYPEGGGVDRALIRPDIFVSFTQDNTNLSFTFVMSGSGAINTIGYVRYNRITQAIGPLRTVFPRSNSVWGSPSCYQIGDTFQFGPFNTGDEIAFWVDNDYINPLYSLIDPPGIGNFVAGTCAEGYNCKQFGWAYLPSADIAVFGVDDYNRGDWDFNDFNFFLWFQGGAVFNKVPSYDAGLIRQCNSESGASFPSMAVINCTQYALLESNSASASCKTFMPIPTGWIWAPDSATSRAAIASLSSKWSYTSATCFILSVSDTVGRGYRANGNTLCTASEYTVSTVNGTQICYNAGCTARFVLRGAELGSACSSTDRCVAGSQGTALSALPSNATSALIYPATASVLLKPLTGSLAMSTTLRSGTSAVKQLIDIVILADFSTVAPTAQQRDATIASYLNEVVYQTGFNTENLNVTIGFVQYKPSATAPFYTLISDYTLYARPIGLTTGIFPTTASACPAAGRSPMYDAAAAVMRNPALNWRPTASHSIWIHSSCALDVSEAVTQAAIDTGVIPVFAFNGDLGGRRVPASFNPSSALGSRTLWSTYQPYANWTAPFFYSSSNSIYPRGAGVFKPLPTTLMVLPMTSIGDPAFLTNMPSSPNTNAATNGFATMSYSLTWPSAGYPYDPLASYTAYVRIMGRSVQSFNIYFNRKPVLPDVSIIANGVLRTLISLSPTDADGNTLQISITTTPSKGVLTDVDLNVITPPATLPVGVYQLYYTPHPFQSGSDMFTVSASDGCASDSADVTISLNFVNTPPIAQDFFIRMDEDSTVNNPVNNGLIDFFSFISDVDINLGGINQILSVILVTPPSPSDKGFLVRHDDLVTTIASGSTNVPLRVRFKLYQPRSSYGNVTFQYQLSDGTNQGNALSNIATVTIQVDHVNHDPVLTIPTTTFFASTALFGQPNPISGFISDIDFLLDMQNLYVVASTLNQFSMQVAGGPVFSSASSLPFQLYTSNFSSTSPTFSITDLSWTGTTAVRSETVVLRAIDSSGGLSATVELTFTTTPSTPPVWSDRPSNSTTNFVPISMMQDTTISNIRFSSTDEDLTEWRDLEFSLISTPSHGTLKLLPLSVGPAPITLSTTDRISYALLPLYVAREANTSASPSPLGHSVFHVEYTPTQGFNSGDDTFTFIVTDPSGNTAEPAVTHITVLRRDTEPESSNITINALENVEALSQISPRSTNLDGPGGIGRPVYVTLESVSFDGIITLADSGERWQIGDATNESTNPFVNLIVKGRFGYYSPEDVVTGFFTYRVHETLSGLSSPIYTANIYITHVNHPPTSQIQNDVVKRGEVLRVTLAGVDPDGDLPVSAKFFSIGAGSQGEFFFDEALTDPLTTDTLSSKSLTNSTFYYRSRDAFTTNNVPLATYMFFVLDPLGLVSGYYRGAIVVLPAGYAPTAGALEVYTYQETPVPMVLALGSVTETGGIPIATVTTPPAFGTFSICDDNNVCRVPNANEYPVVVPASSGRVVFIPRAFDWGMNFTEVPFTLTDASSGAVGSYIMHIHVLHLNKPPMIEAINFLTTSQTNRPTIVNESSSRIFEWRVRDPDSLPSTLRTTMRVSFYTSYGFSLFTCTYVPGQFNTPDCNFDPSAVPFAVRADFVKNARKAIPIFETMTSDCDSASALKSLYGTRSDNCAAHFRLVFAPRPAASYTPYVTISLVASDDFDAESTTISSMIAVKALNSAPTIWTPPIVLGAAGITNPFLRDTDQASVNYGRPIQVNDTDANGNPELLTITVIEGVGNLVWPAGASCRKSDGGNLVWYCLERMDSFKSWLENLRFEVTSGDRAALTFEINDLGFTSDYKPSANLTASSTTIVIIAAGIAPTAGNNPTLVIAVGAAAGIGLLLLGALGFGLRRKVKPVEDDYFNAGTTPLASAAQSPIYQAQNQTHESALYKLRH